MQVPWKYASRAGVWKQDDPTLQVECFSPEDAANPSLAFGDRKTTTTPLPVTVGLNSRPVDTSFQNIPIDCQWTDFSDWTPCSASCNTGSQSRTRTVAQIARNGGRRCEGPPFESRNCNTQRCPIRSPTTSTRGTTTTTRTPFVDTRRPEPRKERVKCFACGSLFSTDAPECGSFNSTDFRQQKTCNAGEACLWYSYLKSSTERSVIRECFSTSILLGSIDRPIEPLNNCQPQNVELGDDSIQACLCTDDFCNGLASPQDSSRSSSRRPTTTPPRAQQIQTQRPKQPSRTSPTQRPPQPPPQPPPRRSNSKQVLCHQCGSLFSGSKGNEDCEVFDGSDQSQRKYCDPGEACLWYSWQKSATEIATIRECFSPTILLGSVDDPLTVKSTCKPKDISETPGASIMACLCNDDLCNGFDSDANNEPLALPQIADPPAPRPRPSNTRREPTRRPSTTNSRPQQPQEDFTDDELNDLLALSKFNQVSTPRHKLFTFSSIRYDC